MKYRVHYTLRDPKREPRTVDLKLRPHIDVEAMTPEAAKGCAAKVLALKFERFHISGIAGPFK